MRGLNIKHYQRIKMATKVLFYRNIAHYRKFEYMQLMFSLCDIKFQQCILDAMS